MDTTEYDVISFWIRTRSKFPNLAPRPDGFWISLVDAWGATSKGQLIERCTRETEDGWRHVVIPLRYFEPMLSRPFDKKDIAGIGLYTRLDGPYSFESYLDDITFEALDAKSLRELCPIAPSPPKAECPNRVDSACVEPVPVDSEHDRWCRETEERFKQTLPKLNRCLDGNAFDEETRAIVTLAFAESGVATEQHIYRSTTSNCEVLTCIKNALQGFETTAPRSKPWRYFAYLTAKPGMGAAFTMETKANFDTFIAKDDRNEKCVEESPKGRMRNGRLLTEVLQDVVRGSDHQIRMCYEKGLPRDRNLCGKVQVRFNISEHGKVQSVYANKGTSMPDCEVVQCIKKMFAELQFPEPEEGIVTVFQSIVFQQE